MNEPGKPPPVSSLNAQPVWVTGAAGFIGARLCEALTQKGTRGLAIDSLPHFTERRELAGMVGPTWQKVERAEFLNQLDELSKGFKPACVFHLGACSDTMNLDVDHHRRWNLEYSQALWSWCARARVPFVYASSAAAYGEGERGYSDDEALTAQLRPLNPYGESKRQFDLWALEQERQGHSPPAWSGFRFFNVYGFGERHKGRMASVVLHAADQIQREGKARLFRSHRSGIADGEQKRDFVAVEDVVKVLLFAAEKPIPRGIYNLGTGQAQTFLNLAHSVFHALGRAPQIEFIDTPEALRARYQYFTQAEMGRLRAQGYTEAFLSLREGVERYVQRLSRS